MPPTCRLSEITGHARPRLVVDLTSPSLGPVLLFMLADRAADRSHRNLIANTLMMPRMPIISATFGLQVMLVYRPGASMTYSLASGVVRSCRMGHESIFLIQVFIYMHVGNSLKDPWEKIT